MWTPYEDDAVECRDEVEEDDDISENPDGSAVTAPQPCSPASASSASSAPVDVKNANPLSVSQLESRTMSAKHIFLS
jgi:hypothetical protein